MKKSVALVAVISLAGSTLFAGPETIIKQRAKELSKQNNARQGVAPPGQPAQPATPNPVAARPAVAQPQLQGAARLKADLAAIKANSPVTTERKQQITRDLLGVARAPVKPSTQSLSVLASDLVTAQSEKPLTPPALSRLVQDLDAALNGATLAQTQMQAIIDDVQAIFQNNGLTRPRAVAIADHLKAITAEVQKPAAK
jgi:hypothetical protein